MLDIAKSTTTAHAVVAGDPTDDALRSVADLAAALCGVPVAIISLDGEDDNRRSLARPAVAGAHGFPFFAAEPLVTVDGDHLGTLCILDRTARDLSPELESALRAVAAVTTEQVLLLRTARTAQRTADQLQDGLLSNRTIGKALGLMMAQYRIDEEAAFAKLRNHSRDLNMKIRDLAERIVDHHNSGCRAAE